ncbi:hypothetical protein ACE1TI_13390 [Alteribacillus sp. JSM 102045]|uniref:hypothetical protein n=1 Tax=Alteribacillus sp. JSM 102045 TaxID=1562101 RepID=UPI0035BF2BFA
MLKSAIYFPPRKRPKHAKEARRKHLLRMLESNEEKLRNIKKRIMGGDEITEGKREMSLDSIYNKRIEQKAMDDFFR